MDELVKKEEKDLLDLLHGDPGALDLVKPFEQSIFLFDSHVAGTSHIEGMKDLEKDLKLEDKLIFYREPNNPFDPQAIRVEKEDGTKIGYVPQVDNLVFSRLMDAGKVLFGKVDKKEWKDDWLYIQMKIYLED